MMYMCHRTVLNFQEGRILLPLPLPPSLYETLISHIKEWQWLEIRVTVEYVLYGRVSTALTVW